MGEAQRNVVAETDRLRLRQWSLEDVDLAFELIHSNAAIMKTYNANGQPFSSREQSKEHMQKRLGSYEKFGYGMWAAEDKATGKLIGEAGVKDFEDGKAVEIGFLVFPEHEGQGYASEAAKACCELAREEAPSLEILAFTHVNNTPAQRVLEKIGMTCTGEEDVRGGRLKAFRFT